MGTLQICVLVCAFWVAQTLGQTADRPDLTMLYESQISTCVAAGNTVTSGLALMTSLGKAPEFEYKDEDGNELDPKYNCDFESGNCKDWPVLENDGVIEESSILRFAPITDERWNKFEIYRTHGKSKRNAKADHKYDKKYTLPKTSYVGISIRAQNNSHIILCEGEDPRKNKCYWIILDGFDHFNEAVIRKCVKGVPDQYPQGDDDCKERRANITIKLLDESKWTHLLLEKKDYSNRNEIRLWYWDENLMPRILLEYKNDDYDVFNSNYMFLRSFQTLAEWKVHQYTYLRFRYYSSFENLLIKDGIKFNSSICLSLYVGVCANCKIELEIAENGGNEIVATKLIEGDVQQEFIKWQNVRLQTATYKSNMDYELYVSLIGINGFWAIDDIRKCSDKEFRVASVGVSNVKCLALQYPGWTFDSTQQIQYADEKATGPPVCENFIGLHCNISCASLGKNGNCQRNKICVATRGEPACTCSAGYRWDSDCAYNCDSGLFGKQCKQKCGQCKNSLPCDVVNGICRECEEGYIHPYCQVSLPYLINPPFIVSIQYRNATVELNNIAISGDVTKASYLLYECRKHGYNERIKDEPWFTCSKKTSIIEGEKIITEQLNKDTKYEIRAVVYTSDNLAFKKKIPTTEFTTTCKLLSEKNIIITTTSTKATIIFMIDEDAESCDKNKYNFSMKDKYENYNDYTMKGNTLDFTRLHPFTNYTFIIMYNKMEIITKTFQTAEDAPSKVENLKCRPNSQNEIEVSWNKPREENGRIKNYIISYESEKRSTCPHQIQKTFSSPVSYYEPAIHKIPDLDPYTNYIITVWANTIKQGETDVVYCETLEDSSIIDEEFPPAILVNVKSSTSAEFRFPYNCTKQRGPLFFKLELHCYHDMWCNEIKHEPIDNIEKDVKTVDLIPFVNYYVTLQAKRSKNGQFSTINRNASFQTPGGVPGPVRNFDIYSKNETTISVRWVEPWPPRGQIENYLLRNERYTITISQENITEYLCDLWDTPFYCYTFTGLYKNAYYYIYISAKNKEDDERGTEIYEITNAIEDKPTEPLKLSHNWDKDVINISWNHPDKTNGLLKQFIVTLLPNSSDLAEQENRTYSYILNVTEYRKTYNRTINEKFRYSSSYTVTVCGMNSFKGEEATLYIDTPPEKPKLSNGFIVQQTTNTSIVINISGAKDDTRSKNSSLYVVVSKVTTVSKRDIEETDMANQILKYASYRESWIAIEQELTGTNTTVKLGDGNQFMSSAIQTKVNNKKLEPETTYEIIVIPVNRYRNKISENPYVKIVKTSATEVPTAAGLWALLLLLLIPIAGYFLYQHVYKKEDRRSSIMMMIPRLRPLQMTRSEDPHEPDVIPLTEAAGEPAQSRPKRPAVAPKPGSSKHPDHHPAAEISSNGTNFFHSRIVLLENLAEYLKEALDNKDLEEQHGLFPRGQTKPWDYGMLKPNKFKNRYSNLIAYDHNRVKLEKINNDQYSDYINASYIHGYRQEKAYIATQGPKQATVNDFWRMIWQENTQYIVMLANVIEGGKRKCEKYWPDVNSSREYGFIDVYFENSELYADYEYRTFILTYKKEQRTIYHLHFTSWPDHGVPLYPQSLVPFLKKILTIPQTNAPIVVHCSAGVGRTGTIILCDICLRMAAREKSIDVLRYLHEIREQRANMVDNSDQYKLVHMVLLECLLAPDTNIPCNAELSQAIQKLIEEGGLQIQLNYLQQSAWQDKALNFVEPKQQDPANNSKNRVQEIVPTENQVYITRFPVTDEYSDYINAVPVDGFRFKEQFIVTQTPMPNTVNDFWRMVSEKSVKTIVSLNDIPLNDPSCCRFWPGENEQMQPTIKITLEHHKLQIYNYYDVHTILLDDKLSQESFTVQIVQFKGWKSKQNLPESDENLVLLWEETETLSHGNYPMVITCYDGATASGLFVAMSFVIEKIKLEQQCDPCLAVRVIRRNRKQFVSNKTQFEFLYRSAVIYLSMFETYSNFQPVVSKSN